VAHSTIPCFLGDTSEAMLAFAQVLPKLVPRIALVDFNNDCVADSLATCRAMFERYRQLIETRQAEEAERYQLDGVRLDTSAALRDFSVAPLGNPSLDLGGNPWLVFLVRQALDAAWQAWDIPAE